MKIKRIGTHDLPVPKQETMDAAEADVDRLNKLDSICEAYGFEGIHEGNRWMIDGPYRDIRAAIDDIKPAMERTP